MSGAVNSTVDATSTNGPLSNDTGDSTNALAGSLGSIIGYLGAEVAEPSIFERLLWPQRFYNYCTPWTTIKMAFMLPMGGPLHKAALETLDAFRRKGLYRGRHQGHMLGTAFYEDLETKYRIHNYKGPDMDDHVRNGLWVLVLRYASYLQSNKLLTPPKKTDKESTGGQPVLLRRTSQLVQHLRLSRCTAEEAHGKNVKIFSEDSYHWHIVIALIASELSAILCALLVVFQYGTYWFAAYLCIPLLLKFLSLPLAVRREPFGSVASSSASTETVIFQILDYDHGFPIIEGPEELVRLFFRHWGHPLRSSTSHRLRELSGIALVLSFVLFFPAGLLGMLWVSQPVQIVWLSYQMYTIVVMHIGRLRGSTGGGRLEEGIAQQLCAGNRVALYTATHGFILASLDSSSVGRIGEGQSKVQEIIRNHAQG